PRAAVPASFTVGVRLSPEEGGFARGLDLDESLEVARWLADDGVDFVHLSLWDATRNTKKRPEEHAIPLFRAVLPAEVRIFAAGAVWTRADGEALLARGADVVALGRAGIANPAWPREVVAEGREPKRAPLTVDELATRAVSPTFSTYLRRFKGFVAP
ncbi:MAG: NADH:flavin oxidoreductase, partial [Myxococcales bacterium]|nr:NADH:flavin oxidoreductase [Myxococcales bacterium]